MTFFATKARVFNRGVPSDEFLTELIGFGRKAPDEYFAPNPNFDIYNKITDELGPFHDLPTRKGALLEVMRVLAMFESSGNWNEGVDSSRHSDTTNENAEAGAWQVSWDSRKLDPSLLNCLQEHVISDGVTFQEEMKKDHMLAMSYIALMLRIDMSNYNRIANGPVRKGPERKETWPDRPKLWHAEESIYPWLSRSSADEIKRLINA